MKQLAIALTFLTLAQLSYGKQENSAPMTEPINFAVDYASLAEKFNVASLKPLGGFLKKDFSDAFSHMQIVCIEESNNVCAKTAALYRSEYKINSKVLYSLHKFSTDSLDSYRTKLKNFNIGDAENNVYYMKYTGNALLATITDNGLYAIAIIPALVVDGARYITGISGTSKAETIEEAKDLSAQQKFVFNFIMDPVRINSVLKIETTDYGLYYLFPGRGPDQVSQ